MGSPGRSEPLTPDAVRVAARLQTCRLHTTGVPAPLSLWADLADLLYEVRPRTADERAEDAPQLRQAHGMTLGVLQDIHAIRPEGSWWHRWRVGVRIFRVEVPVVSHLVAIAILAFLAWSTAVQVPSAPVLGLTTTNATASALPLDALVHGGRVVHEAGHALAGIATGRRVRSVRLTPPADLDHRPAARTGRAA